MEHNVTVTQHPPHTSHALWSLSRGALFTSWQDYTSSLVSEGIQNSMVQESFVVNDAAEIGLKLVFKGVSSKRCRCTC